MFQLNNPKQIALERERPAKGGRNEERSKLSGSFDETFSSAKENRESEVE